MSARHPMTGNEMSGSESGGMERHRYDVVVIGAGGAGLRAAIAAQDAGARTAIVCKSLLGKAHTVMAEGGIAASMGNVYPEDNWEVHFRDTMRGGKMLNNWRMAQLHAQEAPERVMELEDWGALFDRTEDGLISQRDFGGHKYARLAHVGDRTGLEMIRTLQQRAVALGIDVFMECTVTELLKEGEKIAGAFGYWRETGRFVTFEAPSVVLATGGIGKSFKVTSNSWEYTGDGHALALRAGASLINMEFVQFHPTGMVWPPSVKGLLVTESVRGDGGILKNSEGKRFMFDYIPEFFRAETADTIEEADRWYEDKKNNRRPPELLPRDEVARAINSEIKAGRGTPHGGIYLDIASRRTPEFIRRRLPSMYHQFKELADVDITAEPMEIGPTCHYVMGGVEVDADTELSAVPGLYAVGECSGGMHGSNRLGGNSLSDLLVFGRRAGESAASYADSLGDARPAVAEARREGGGAERPRAVRCVRFSGEGWREPLLHPVRPAGVDERPGRDHPDRARAGAVAPGDRGVQGTGPADEGRGAPAVQPRLAPGDRPAQHADRQRVHREGGPRATGVPRRAHPRRLPRPERGVGHQEPRPQPERRGHRRGPGRETTARHARRAQVVLRGLDRLDYRGEGTAMSYELKMRIWRGDQEGGDLGDYTVSVETGEVVLDAIHRVQATQAGDLAVRWNCKAGKCGSCSAEINGRPRLMCMTRLSDFDPSETITVTPMRAFPVIRDLVTDVSFNYEKAAELPSFAPPPRDADGKRRMMQLDVERGQEFRKCIECFLCQDTCHVVRDHEENKPAFAGPRFFLRYAELDMHPLDTHDRRELAQGAAGIGMCNITKCCTEVCPEGIKITDNAIIPMKERVADRKYDPLVWLGNKIGLRNKDNDGRTEV